MQENFKKFLEEEIQEMKLNNEISELFETTTVENMSYWAGRSSLCYELLQDTHKLFQNNTMERCSSAAIMIGLRHSKGDISKLIKMYEIIEKLTPNHSDYFKTECIEMYGGDTFKEVEDKIKLK